MNNCLFGSEELIKNAEPDNNQYHDYNIEFDSDSVYSFTDGSVGKKYHYCLSCMISSVHIDNKNTDISLLDEEPTQVLHDATLNTEAKYHINFTQSGKRFCIKSTI